MENGDDDADEKDDQIELSWVAWVLKTWTYTNHFVTLTNYTWTFIPELCVYLAVDGVPLLQAWEQEQEEKGHEKDGDSKFKNSSKLINETMKLM